MYFYVFADLLVARDSQEIVLLLVEFGVALIRYGDIYLFGQPQREFTVVGQPGVINFFASLAEKNRREFCELKAVAIHHFINASRVRMRTNLSCVVELGVEPQRGTRGSALVQKSFSLS